MDLNVRKDASMEEVVGFALWNYWEDGWLPKLDEGTSGEDDPKLSAVGWIMRIAESDGEVDEDFPRQLFLTISKTPDQVLTCFISAPDRTGKISKFNFEAYAVLEATPTQSKKSGSLINI